MDLHALAEERSLAYHREVAARLARRPELISVAKRRAEEWASQGEGHAPYAKEWLRVLAGTIDEIAAQLIDPSERGRALRQASPFSGALDPRERWKLWRDVRARWESG
ncbi:MAG: hypothetical protein ACJ783_15360 [Myxococcales bacterium]